VSEVVTLGNNLIEEFGYSKRTSVELADFEKMDYFRNLLV
jgi:hypothetical protein